jgi:hypothetical protein
MIYDNRVIPNPIQVECKEGIKIIEFTLTAHRHEIKSEFTSEVVSQSIFPHTVDEVMNLENHISVADKVFQSLKPITYCIVYLTGLTILVQALYISWRTRILVHQHQKYGKLIFHGDILPHLNNLGQDPIQRIGAYINHIQNLLNA